MTRAIWKGLNCTKTKLLEHGKKVWFKNIVISKEDIGKEVEIYNGNKFFNVLLEEKMIGTVLGSYILTKKIGNNIHKKKVKGKKKN